MNTAQFRELRRKYDYTMTQMSEVIGVSWATVDRWEKKGVVDPERGGQRIMEMLYFMDIAMKRDPVWAKSFCDKIRISGMANALLGTRTEGTSEKQT